MTKIKVILVSALIAFSVTSAATNLPTITGYFQPRWQATLADSSFENTFRFRRVILGLKGNLTDYLNYKLTLAAHKASISLLDAYIDIKPHQLFAFRIGQFKIPMGMDKLSSGSTTLFPERPAVSGFVMDRDLAVMAALKTKLIGLQLAISNGEGRNKIDLNENKDLSARLTIKPLKFLHIGGAYMMGKYSFTTPLLDTLLNFNRWGAELAVNPGPLWLAGELMGGVNDTVSAMRYYFEAAWTFELDKNYLYAIQPAARYEMIDPDTKTNNDSRNLITAGINLHFMPKHKLKLNLCYILVMEETNSVKNDEVIAQFQWKI